MNPTPEAVFAIATAAFVFAGAKDIEILFIAALLLQNDERSLASIQKIDPTLLRTIISVAVSGTASRLFGGAIDDPVTIGRALLDLAKAESAGHDLTLSADSHLLDEIIRLARDFRLRQMSSEQILFLAFVGLQLPISLAGVLDHQLVKDIVDAARCFETYNNADILGEAKAGLGRPGLKCTIADPDVGLGTRDIVSSIIRIARQHKDWSDTDVATGALQEGAFFPAPLDSVLLNRIVSVARAHPEIKDSTKILELAREEVAKVYTFVSGRAKPGSLSMKSTYPFNEKDETFEIASDNSRPVFTEDFICQSGHPCHATFTPGWENPRFAQSGVRHSIVFFDQPYSATAAGRVNLSKEQWHLIPWFCAPLGSSPPSPTYQSPPYNPNLADFNPYSPLANPNSPDFNPYAPPCNSNAIPLPGQAPCKAVNDFGFSSLPPELAGPKVSDVPGCPPGSYSPPNPPSAVGDCVVSNYVQIGTQTRVLSGTPPVSVDLTQFVDTAIHYNHGTCSYVEPWSSILPDARAEFEKGLNSALGNPRDALIDFEKSESADLGAGIGAGAGFVIGNLFGAPGLGAAVGMGIGWLIGRFFLEVLVWEVDHEILYTYVQPHFFHDGTKLRAGIAFGAAIGLGFGGPADLLSRVFGGQPLDGFIHIAAAYTIESDPASPLGHSKVRALTGSESPTDFLVVIANLVSPASLIEGTLEDDLRHYLGNDCDDEPARCVRKKIEDNVNAQLQIIPKNNAGQPLVTCVPDEGAGKCLDDLRTALHLSPEVDAGCVPFGQGNACALFPKVQALNILPQGLEAVLAPQFGGHLLDDELTPFFLAVSDLSAKLQGPTFCDSVAKLQNGFVPAAYLGYGGYCSVPHKSL